MLSLPTRRELVVNYQATFLKARSALAMSFIVNILVI
jgi:hypothetical protein